MLCSWEDEEEDVSSSWMALRTSKNAVNWQGTRRIAMYVCVYVCVCVCVCVCVEWLWTCRETNYRMFEVGWMISDVSKGLRSFLNVDNQLALQCIVAVQKIWILISTAVKTPEHRIFWNYNCPESLIHKAEQHKFHHHHHHHRHHAFKDVARVASSFLDTAILKSV